MVTPLAFWEAFRRALVSPSPSKPANVFGTHEWTYWTCFAACQACRYLGFAPRSRLCGGELQRFDVVGLDSQHPNGRWAIAYEHEGGDGQDRNKNWRDELGRKLWPCDAQLKVLVGYPSRGRHPSTVDGELQEEVNRLRLEIPTDLGANWLFAFGVGNTRKFPDESWRVFTLSVDGTIQRLTTATELVPRRDIR